MTSCGGERGNNIIVCAVRLFPDHYERTIVIHVVDIRHFPRIREKGEGKSPLEDRSRKRDSILDLEMLEMAAVSRLRNKNWRWRGFNGRDCTEFSS